MRKICDRNMLRTSWLTEISVMGFFFGKILCGCHAVVFFEDPVEIGYTLKTTGFADDREGIAALLHLVYGMTEAEPVDIFFYGERFRLPDSPVDVAFGDPAGFGNIPDRLKCCIVGVNIIDDPPETGSFILADGNLLIQRVLMAENG